ncbi:MAG: hypothetical protein GX660_25015 [Clostridiaceae bacterium]|nr:hypothetical protein [Clostridiaceae bacterium]
MSDKTLVCKDCSAQFIFTEGEQNFYKEKGFSNEPQRCLSCRNIKKQQNRRSSGFSSGRNFGNNFSAKAGGFGFINR